MPGYTPVPKRPGPARWVLWAISRLLSVSRNSRLLRRNWTMSRLCREGCLKSSRSPFIFYVQIVDLGGGPDLENIFLIQKLRSQDPKEQVTYPRSRADQWWLWDRRTHHHWAVMEINWLRYWHTHPATLSLHCHHPCTPKTETDPWHSIDLKTFKALWLPWWVRFLCILLLEIPQWETNEVFATSYSAGHPLPFSFHAASPCQHH